MATDDTGKVSTISYSPRDDFFVFAELNGLKIGSVVEAKWFAVNLPEIEPNSEINTSDYVYQPLIESVYFRLTTPNGGDWPIGTYKVEIYLDGQLVGGQSFMVQ